jgi:hypothetical protein
MFFGTGKQPKNTFPLAFRARSQAGRSVYALVRAFFRIRTSVRVGALVLSIVVWAPLDSALCIYYGLYPAVA